MINIHPLLVHFPIAFLVLYSLLEIVSIKRFKYSLWLSNTKALLVITGFIGGLFAALSGGFIEDKFSSIHQIVEMHSFWAGTSNVIFGIISILYLIKILNQNNVFNFNTESFLGKAWAIKIKVSNYILNNRLMLIPIVLIGLISITITGALGASIVYGPNIDPAVKFIYNLVL